MCGDSECPSCGAAQGTLTEFNSGWVSNWPCRFCQGKNVIPIQYPETDYGPAELAWECLDCDMAWEVDIDQSGLTWNVERIRYWLATTPKGRVIAVVQEGNEPDDT